MMIIIVIILIVIVVFTNVILCIVVAQCRRQSHNNVHIWLLLPLLPLLIAIISKMHFANRQRLYKWLFINILLHVFFVFSPLLAYFGRKIELKTTTNAGIHVIICVWVLFVCWNFGSGLLVYELSCNIYLHHLLRPSSSPLSMVSHPFTLPQCSL